MTKQIKRKYKQDVGVKELYSHYSQLYFKERFIRTDGTTSKNFNINHDSKYNIGSTLFNKVLKAFHKLKVNAMLNGDDFILPERLGVLGIRKNKITIKVNEDGIVETNAPINFKATMDLWEKDPEAKKNKTIIRHLNEHTRRYIHRWYWNKHDANFRNKTAYCFIPSRDNKRKLAALLKDENNTIDFYTRYSKNKKF